MGRLEDDQRRAWTKRWGAMTLDTVLGASNLTTCANAPYHDLESLLAFATGILEVAGAAARFHSFHSGRSTDIVIELHGGVPIARWWSTDEPIAELTSIDDRTLFEDAALRDVAGTIEAQGISAARTAIEHALSAAPGRKELVGIAGSLVHAGMNGLAGRIVDDRLEHDPDDVDAMILDARMTMNLVNQKQWGPDKLPAADARLRRVLELDPANLRAKLMWSDLPRFAGDPATSISRFTAIVEQHPTCHEAHYNLGAIFLPEQPARALEHFHAGARLAPNDADYPLGVARCYLALGRAYDARVALERGREIDPDHRLIAQIEARLGTHP